MRVLVVAALALGAVSLSACETVGGVLTNATGSATEVEVVHRDGQTVRLILPEGRGLVLRRPLADIDHVEYGRGCRLTGDQIQAAAAPAWNEARSISLTVCDGATP
ncbi:MAG: hypothetical protein RLZZ542_135 [Pseudomonadota bacterium]|jgi:hypothetical protein